MVRRVAVLGDVHGNAVALAAVLDELRGDPPELVVWTGDLSWGWEPAVTLALVRSLEIPARYVRGNAERSVLELRAGKVDEPSDRERWMLGQHTSSDLAFVETFEHCVSVDIEALGPTRFCHGSPRSDEELLTVQTPEDRIVEATSEITERVLVTGHTHAQYDRTVSALRAVNPGSVGMPYEAGRGTYWALLGPGVEFRRTEYDVDEAASRPLGSGLPNADQLVEILTSPPTPAEMIEHAERVQFSG